MACLLETLPVIIYFLLIILIVALIAISIKSYSILEKLDKLIDNAADKVNSLNGFFSVMDKATDTISILSDKLVTVIVSSIQRIFTKKEEDKHE